MLYLFISFNDSMRDNYLNFYILFLITKIDYQMKNFLNDFIRLIRIYSVILHDFYNSFKLIIDFLNVFFRNLEIGLILTFYYDFIEL